MKKILYTTAIFVMGLHTLAFCQADGKKLENAFSGLKTMLNDHIIEKAYLHFDRPYPYYVAGETVYFKAYVTMGERHEPSTISGILHVDLIDKNDALMQSVSLQLNNGVGWGDFALPDNLQKGSYRIRAYTQWMRNDSNPYFFDQYISVSSVNSVDRIADNTPQAAEPSLRFFPEGGDIVADLPSKVAFKALGTTGVGINVKGIVLDNDNKEVAKIASTHMGMGSFIFTPETGKTYKARLTFADGRQSTVALPAIEAKGITLAVNTADPSKVSIEIKANRAYYKENFNKEFTLALYYSGSVKTFKPKLDNSILGLDLPANSFRSGILQVTLFSENGEPLNERLAFIQNPDLLNLSLNTNKSSFAKRESVQMNINAKNKDGNPVNGSFSVAVVDESKILVDENNEHTIISSLLLTTELKGYIEKPNYYFANVTNDTRADLDALMLTQGYRRFAWKQLMDQSAAVAGTFKAERGIDLSGELKTKAGAPIPDTKITLIAEAGGPVNSVVTDAQGKFNFNSMTYMSGTRFILKVESSGGKKGIVTFDSPNNSPAIMAGNPVEARYNANADILASLQNNQRMGIMTASNEANVLLKDDKVIGAIRGPGYRSTNLGGAGHADQVVLGDAIKNAPTMSVGLSGLLRGVQFSDGGVPSLRTGMTVSSSGVNLEPMLVVLDGLELGHGIDIDQFNPISVEAVEVLKGANASIYGVSGGQGVMVITTRQGGGSEAVVTKEMSPGIFAIQPTGFYKAREFYIPAYNPNQPSGNLTDNRTTIFWKPDVNTDADGNASFNFPNSDGTGTYRVVVEGMDTKGNLGRQVFTYKVH